MTAPAEIAVNPATSDASTICIVELYDPRPRRTYRRVRTFALLVDGKKDFLHYIFRIGTGTDNFEPGQNWPKKKRRKRRSKQASLPRAML
jgi:hypothetical protein